MESHHGKLQGYEGCRRIDIDIWLKAIEDAKRERPNQGNEGFTAQELSSMFKIGKERMKSHIREMIRAGKVVPAPGFRPAIDGILRHVPVYILKKEK